MSLNRVKVAVDESEKVIIVNREQWDAMPAAVRTEMIEAMERQHNTKLTVRLIDGDPHDDNENGNERIEVDNLLVPDYARAVQLHYHNGGVEVATLTHKGWTRVLESGEHLCDMPTPYFEEVPPSTIIVLSTLPKEGLGNTSVDMMDDESNKFRLRAKQPPIILDTSGSNESIEVPQDEELRDINREAKRKLDNIREASKLDGLGNAEAARVAFEAMYEGTVVMQEYANRIGAELGHADPLMKLFSRYLMSCMNFDPEHPEQSWDAFRGAVETLFINPDEYLGPSGNPAADAEIQEMGRVFIRMLEEHPEYAQVNQAVQAGKPFTEWCEGFWLVRMHTTSAIHQAMKELR